jgi:HAD superfamily phosphoserine phosphatase-like hydrolase
VLFDFDGTLNTRDTVQPFALFVARNHRHRISKTAGVITALGALKLHLISNQMFKRWLCRILTSGETQQWMSALAAQFMQAELERNASREVFRKLDEHASKGDEVYILSSNFDFLLSSLPKRYPICGVMATEAELRDGVFTGALATRSCHGTEKVQRIIARFGEQPARTAIAYADQRSDSDLLNFVHQGYWVEHEGKHTRIRPHLNSSLIPLHV